MKPLTRHQIAWRAAQDLEEGSYVNLGLGLPTLISNYKPEDRDFMFHSENGIVGVGRRRKRRILTSSTRAARRSPCCRARRSRIRRWPSR
jgi:acyl CoA:acetate/3-ketoacid CoA transferase beta subunit